MMDKERAKSEIAKLVEKYEREKGKRYNEEATKNDFILPLFKILGWDVENSNEVSKEENISGKRVDYGFRIDGIPKFFLEAKSLDEDLESSRLVKGRHVTYAEQAINYAYYKGCNWAILTNFKGIIVYDAWAKANSQSSFRFAIWVDSLLSDFESVYLLSKEAFGQGLLDKKYSTKSRKRPITEQLLLDFTNFRAILSKDVYALNKSKNLTEEELDEAIQRLFDRLIFIRNCEDRELEPPELLSALRQWKESRKGTLVSKLRELFVHFDDIYNSKIFSKHLCDQVDISDNVLSSILDGLYTTEDGSIQYDFSLIDADVLGNIYEQYLGHILKKTEKRTKLTESKAKRKEEGIYYTPSYIVDYIVRNTVGELVKNKKTDVSKIKVLDPACGSGSFLIKTFDVLNEYHSKKESYSQNKLDMSGTGTTYSTKLGILKDNIFGVDLDKQAVDIAQLNLLLKVAEKKRRLPILQQNIKNGNSLIDDPNLAGDKAFKWNEKFAEIMHGGGFDVVVGNPPYFNIRKNLTLQKFVETRYPEIYNGQNDVLYYFVQRALSLLKEGGYLGFIVSRYFLESDSAKKFREYILNNCEIKEIVDFGNNQVFDGVNVLTAIMILKKIKSPERNNKISILKLIDNQNPIWIIDLKHRKIIENLHVKQGTLDSKVWIFQNEMINALLKKIDKNSISLGNIARTGAGIQAGLNEVFVVDQKIIKDYNLEDKLLRNYVKTKDIKPYRIINRNLKVIELLDNVDIEAYPNIKNYMLKHRDKLKMRYEAKKNICKWYAFAVQRNLDIFDSDQEKIITPIYSTSNKFGYDPARIPENYLTLSDTAVIQIKDKDYQTKAVLAILNSKLMNFYYKKTRKLKRDNYYEYLSKTLETLPIKYSKNFEFSVIPIVDKILFLSNSINRLEGKLTEEFKTISNQCEEALIKIDNLVYKLYGITDVERKVIEESIK